MGDISVIARRLSDKYVQYGWSGNGGYFKTVGLRLLTWYDTPEMVEYLFGLGQLRHLWEPHSEKTSGLFRTTPDGMPHWVDPSERWMFSKIAFVDYGYFYDGDGVWYYVCPGPFRVKLPLTLVAANLDGEGYEFDFRRQVGRRVLEALTGEEHLDYLASQGHSPEAIQAFRDTAREQDASLYQLWEKHRSVCGSFDDWVLVRPDETGEGVGEIVVRHKEDPHVETLYW